jgi:hypothetical protein
VRPSLADPAILGSSGPRPLDSVVNVNLAGVNIDPIVPSQLQGRAQLQLFPPTLAVTDSSGSRITLLMELISRYFPDPNTPPVAQFMRGSLQITAPISHMGSFATNVIDLDFRSPAVSINFTPSWSSSPVATADLLAVNLLIRNALKTSFLPSNAVVPPQIRQLAFKTFGAPSSAIGVLLNVRDESGLGNPTSANSAFLGAGDDFAFAVGIDFVLATFGPTLESIVSTPIPSVPVAWSHYTVELDNDPTLTLQQPDRIVLTFRGEAKTPSYWLPNFDFVVRQGLRLVVDGPTADFTLERPSFELSNDIADWIAGPFKGGVENRIAAVRDSALEQSQARQKVRRLMNADENLGVFLNSLFTPPRTKAAPPTPLPHAVELAYTGVSVQQAGIVLHGSLSVPYWPPPHVEFEEIPHGSGGPADIAAVPEGPDYSALKTWIPGGVIQQFEWHSPGPGSHYIDPNRFVLLDEGPVVSDGVATRALPGYTGLCLTINGSRLTASGPAVAQPVGATFCAFTSFPVVGIDIADIAPPMIALVERDPHGLVRVTGHTPARSGSAGSAPNLLVHFVGDTRDTRLEELVGAVREGRTEDGATAVVAVTAENQLESASYVAGVTYADDRDGKWSARFGLKTGTRNTTLIVNTDGRIVWRHEGRIERQALRDALRQHVKPVKGAAITANRSKVRIGHPPPNILFEYSPGRMLTLRKISRRPVTLVFWRADAGASIDAILDLQSEQHDGESQRLVLAINDGDSADDAAKVASGKGLSAILVTDPDRTISLGYGITMWPTIIEVDTTGIVRAIRYGRPARARGVEQHV